MERIKKKVSHGLAIKDIFRGYLGFTIRLDSSILKNTIQKNNKANFSRRPTSKISAKALVYQLDVTLSYFT
jgi:hypothetical protein